MPEPKAVSYDYLETIFGRGLSLDGCFLRCVNGEPINAFVVELVQLSGDEDQHQTFQLAAGPGNRRDRIVVSFDDRISYFAPTRGATKEA
jgi:hypothetical protein